MPKDSLLWSVHKGESNKSFLFGSIHLFQEEIKPVLEQVNPYLINCDAFYAEVDLDDMLVEPMLPFITLDTNQRYTDYVRQSQWNKMEKLCKQYFSIDLKQMEHMIPLFILHQLQLSLLPSHHVDSLDSVLWKEAESRGKYCGGLEDLQEHFSTLKKIPLPFQYKSLKQTFRNISKFINTHKKIISLYQNQDIRQIYSLSRKILGPNRRCMLMDRNHIMLESIITAMQHKTSFFAIGAGHLYGNEGVLAMLKRRDYKVLPVSIQLTT